MVVVRKHTEGPCVCNEGECVDVQLDLFKNALRLVRVIFDVIKQ